VVDARRQRGTCHPYRLPFDAPPTHPHRVGHAQQRFGVLSRFPGRADYLVITRFFCGDRNLPFEPPRQRMEPEHATIHMRQQAGK
jgi:hypothetical protein